MKILKKHGFSAAVLVIAVILGTLFGVHRSVGREARRIEAQFYDGVYLENEKYTQASISDMLEERANNALGALTLVSGKYDALALPSDELRSARDALLSAESIEEKYLANIRLTKAAQALRDEAGSVSLDGRDGEGLAMYLDNMESAQRVIDGSAYNDAVRGFINGTLREFPVRLLKNISFCKYPSYFNVEG